MNQGIGSKILACWCWPMLLGEFIKQHSPVGYEEFDRRSEGFLVSKPTGDDWLTTQQLIDQDIAGNVIWGGTEHDMAIDELLSLTEKHNKLSSFIGSEAFTPLPQEDKEDLMGQCGSMGECVWFFHKIVKRNLNRIQPC